MIYVKPEVNILKDLNNKQITMTELAEQIGCCKGTISAIFSGKRNPSPKIAIKICEKMGKQFEYYFFISNVCR